MPKTCVQLVHWLWGYVGTICVQLPTQAGHMSANEQFWCAKLANLAHFIRMFRAYLRTSLFGQKIEVVTPSFHTFHSTYYIYDELKKGE